ncbi:hypothetical protein NUW54_g7628 [Trametes sanguinea]|uniref:Uncharacterized protein n=1 Tax=Trametes sanguinea TaxID=158606 RepID=A0ACC1PJ25_9APHY|nr:hypothetical protein NUW54_g7628 [Trametes sanguinea]
MTYQSGKPTTPPPPYSEHANPQQSTSTTPGFTAPGAQPPLPVHAGYDSASVSQQIPLLSSHDPLESYRLAEARARSRREFMKAILWGVAILAAVSFVTTLEIRGLLAGRTNGGT